MLSEVEVKNLKVGAVVTGKVTGIKKFGAFIELAPNITGLVHISEISDGFVKEVSDYLKEGQTVKVKILSVNENGKMELSVKQAEENHRPIEKTKAEKSFSQKSQASSKNNSFEDMMAKFMKRSEEKLSDMGAAAEVKRRRPFHRGNQ